MAKEALSASARRLESTMQRIARTISGNWGVQVVFDGIRPQTDGKIIHLPYTAENVEGEKQVIMHGYLNHETAHVAEEEAAKAAGRPTPVKLLNSQKNQTVRWLFNVFEDIRIERK